jgi:hypothetical protein
MLTDAHEVISRARRLTAMREGIELGNDAIQAWKIWWTGIFKVGD